MIQTIDGVQYLNMLRGGAQNLNRFRTEVNDLNVFPIPDGDTGDNMFMTVNAGAVKAQENVSVAVTADSAAQEMLMGARGNSGVILSRIFAGIAKGMNNADHLNTDGFTEAMRMGVTESYGAVSTPVEGTILTVYREGVEKVEEKHPRSFEELFELLLAELKESLEHTPELLDVLKEADLNAFTEDSELEFGYCTEFLLRLQNSKVDIDNFDVDSFTAWLNSVGDSVVCFKEGSIVKAHVHTKRPGDILNHCQRYGEFLTTKIENMTLQHNGSHGMQELKLKKRKPQKPYGIVTVASGDGLKELFVSLGCDVVVDGGQSMNPSTEDLIRAFDECSAETIYVFPNNSNIILTAQQAAQLYDNADVRIVLTKTIGEGYSAISMFDLSAGDPDAVTESLNELIKGVVTGMVSRASRDVSGGAVEVVKDDYIGFVGDEIYVDEPTAEDAMIALCDKLNAGNYDILLILAGKEPSAENARKMVDTLSEKYKRSEVIMVNGDQPIYDYILILE